MCIHVCMRMCMYVCMGVCAGNGPWVMADLESGVWGGGKPSFNPTNTPLNTSLFVTAMVKGRSPCPPASMLKNPPLYLYLSISLSIYFSLYLSLSPVQQ